MDNETGITFPTIWAEYVEYMYEVMMTQPDETRYAYVMVMGDHPKTGEEIITQTLHNKINNAIIEMYTKIWRQ